MRGKTLAKLSAPRPQGAVARPRLFDLLDVRLAHAALWVSAPAGAGKTTLLSSYLRIRGRNAMWYRVDAGDADPAVLFECLRGHLGARASRLPLLTPEHQRDLAGFARRFFRDFFSRIPVDSLLVFDGVEAAGGSLDIVLDAAMAELPDGDHLIVLSRDPPPAKFARASLDASLGILNWEDLRLTAAESAAVAQQTAALDQDVVDALHVQCDGWVAGLRLLLEHTARSGTAVGAVVSMRPEALFAYFATEVFERLPGDVQSVLLRTSPPPKVTRALCVGLLGDSNAMRLLSELAACNLFVTRFEGHEAIFQYHALFRDFLIAQARRRLQPDEYRRLQMQTARLLVDAGEPEHAVALLAAAGDWSGASRLIQTHASAMLARGQSMTLRGWLQRLPPWFVAATSRLLYSLGLAQCTADPLAACSLLERAHRGFVSEKDALGQSLALAAIVHARYLAFDAFDALDPVIESLDALLRQGLDFPTGETELHVCSMLQLGMSYRLPTSPALTGLVQRILRLIASNLEINQTIAAAAALLPYCDWFAPDTGRVVIAVAQSRLPDARLSAFNRIWWLMARGHHHLCAGESESLHRTMQEARSVVRRVDERSAALVEALTRLVERIGDPSAQGGGDDVAQLTALAHPHRRSEQLTFMPYAAELALQRGNVESGMELALRSLDLARATGHRASEIESLQLSAIGHCLRGDWGSGLQSLASVRALAGDASPRLAFHHGLIEAFAHIVARRKARASARLREAFALGRQHGYMRSVQWVPLMAATLCVHALNAGIEPNYVCQLIRHHRLQPPPGAATESWPWTVRVRVFGEPTVFLSEERLRFTGKTQHRPLQLLRALVTKGPGGADVGVLAAELWPDSEGDAAASALRMALHRLRKLLRDDDAVLLDEGRLRLHRALCWVDAWAFDSQWERIGNSAWDVESVEAALRLYRGPAFDGETLQPWMLPARDRWHSRFVRMVERHGEALRAGGRWHEAIALYQRGLDVDAACEPFHQQLMACHLEQGSPELAEAAYQRCSALLRATMGVTPNAAIEALRLRANARERRA